MKKQVIPGPEARIQILEGAKLLYEAVSTTLGPKGNNAVIEAFGEPIVTHDGVTVAKAVEVSSEDRPGVRVGVELIKSSSSKTNDNVGDGTTSSTILAYHLIDEGLKCIEKGKNPMVLRKELETAASFVLAELEKLAEPVETKKALIQVATISSENEEIGKQVGSMYHELGKDAMVAVEIGTKPTIEYEIVEGYNFDRGVLDPMMISDSRTQTTTLEDPAVLIINGKADRQMVEPYITDLWNAGKNSLLIICDGFKTDLLEASMVAREKINVIGVKAPGFGDQKLELLKDIAILTGTEVYKDQTTTPGTIGKAVISLKETVLTGGKDVSEHISDLQAIREKTKAEFDKEKIDRRIAQLRGKVGLIRVGGATEMEAEERKYLIDDATCAVEAAMKEGIVPGGATTYVHLSKTFDDDEGGGKILRDALQAPFKILMQNAGLRYGVLLDQLTFFGRGFDVMGDGEQIDLKEHGIIDPVLVIKQAITNAVSVASSALTTGVLIVNEKQKDKESDE